MGVMEGGVMLELLSLSGQDLPAQEITEKTLELVCSGLVSGKLPESAASQQAKTTNTAQVVRPVRWQRA